MTSLLKRLSTGRHRKRRLLGRYRRILTNNKKYIRTVNILGWVLCFLSMGLYIFTMYPTVSFWDSGEFLSSSSHLQIGHQPGAPLYQIIGALLSSLAFGNGKVVAMIVNSLSAISAGISIMLLFHIFLYLFNKYSERYVGNILAAFLASSIFALTDSFWTSATEAEVYTMSFLFTTLCIRTILHWDEKPNERWIILLCFILGLSVGIHPLTMLSIPAIVVIIYFHYKRISLKNIIIAIIISLIALLVFTQAFPTILYLANISMFVLVLLFILLFGLLFISYRKKIAWLNSLVFCVLFFFIGCSSYTIVLLRGKEYLPMNEYRIENAKDLNNYISRQAYTKAPLLYGAYYTDWPPKDFEIKDNKLEPIFDKELMTVFPRMWNYNSESYINNYVAWTGEPKNSVNINGEDIPKPSFVQNLSYFISYQLGYMYFRYLFWNFTGRTNDMQGDGSLTNGQAKTGLYLTDKLYNIYEGETTESLSNKANNKYFLVPFLLCLIGMFYHLSKDSKRFLFVATIFLMYSVAIVVYLNSTAYEVRERDYVYLPSFMAVSIWIGIGMLGISQIIANIIRLRKPRYILPIFLIVPIWIGIENFDDHNHHHQYTAYNFAVSMLNSCERNSILIVDGDNDTYPLWYCQNVEHIREDVRVINRELLNNSYTIDKLKINFPKSPAIKLLMKPEQYKDGVMTAASIVPSFDVLDMKEGLSMLYASKGDDKKFKDYFKTLHTNKFKIHRSDGEIDLNLDMLSLPKSDIVILDILASNPERPVYFSSYSNLDFINLDDYLSLEGFAYRVNGKKVSTKGEVIAQKVGALDDEKMYENIMHGFSFKNFNNNIYFNDTERSIIKFYVQNIRSLAYKLLQKDEREKALALIDKYLVNFPTKIHYYPLALADMALICSVCDKEDMATKLLETSLTNFENFMERYLQGTIRFQSEKRLEAAEKINYYMDLCLLAEDWGEEDIRVSLAESFFKVIRPYLEITYRQKKIMLLNNNYYSNEIENIDELIRQIQDFAKHYEEVLPEQI